MKHLFILIILTPILIFPQLTESQKQTCKSVNTIKIVVTQNYGKAGSKNLPFQNKAKQLLSKYTKLAIITDDSLSADGILNITVNGRALSNKYSTSPFTSSGIKHYSGARLEGSFSYSISQIPYYEGSFVGYESTPFRIDRSYNSPQEAPFYKAFENMSLQSELIKMVGDIYGVEPVIKALEDPSLRSAAIQTCIDLDDPLVLEPLIAAINHEYPDYHNIISALGEIKDPRAVPALISELKYSREAVHALGNIGDPRAIKPLIDLLGININKGYQYRAKDIGKALKKITGKNYGWKKHAKWLQWWEENKSNYY